jgi:phosphohistidine phosphatase SixA
MQLKHILAGISGLCLVLIAATAVADDRLAEQVNAGGRVLMIRHAYAPGSGDPANFQIGDCATQRNLNDAGREQARRIGVWLRARGITAARVYTSQWCRCRETAELLGLGPVADLPALNSFYERPRDREPNLAALEAFFARQPADGPLVVLVTHYVTIAGITGQGVSSGEGVLLQLQGSRDVEVLRRLSFGL